MVEAGFHQLQVSRCKVLLQVLGEQNCPSHSKSHHIFGIVSDQNKEVTTTERGVLDLHLCWGFTLLCLATPSIIRRRCWDGAGFGSDEISSLGLFSTAMAALQSPPPSDITGDGVEATVVGDGVAAAFGKGFATTTFEEGMADRSSADELSGKEAKSSSSRLTISEKSGSILVMSGLG